MGERRVTVTYVGGPTALLELAGVRLLTDPTFDPAGTAYPATGYTLRKTLAPAVSVDDLGAVNGVLLSHDHHFDNLDHAGREVAARAGAVYTTPAAAGRLGGAARGLAAWESATCNAGGGSVRITATPGRHGPAGGDRGPVTGFVLDPAGGGGRTVYVSGDTVWFDGVADVGRRFPVAIALLNLGAAKVSVAGSEPLTFTAAEAVQLARAWAGAVIVPLHFEGWEHFSEGRPEIERAFARAGLSSRLRFLPAGVPTGL